MWATWRSQQEQTRLNPNRSSSLIRVGKLTWLSLSISWEREQLMIAQVHQACSEPLDKINSALYSPPRKMLSCKKAPKQFESQTTNSKKKRHLLSLKKSNDHLQKQPRTLTPDNFPGELHLHRDFSPHGRKTKYDSCCKFVSCTSIVPIYSPLLRAPTALLGWDLGAFWAQWQTQLLNCRWLELCDMVRYLAGSGREKIVPSGHWGDGHGQQQYSGSSVGLQQCSASSC